MPYTDNNKTHHNDGPILTKDIHENLEHRLRVGTIDGIVEILDGK
jgi:hypothetical protein